MPKVVRIEDRLKRNKRIVPLEDTIKGPKGQDGFNGRDGKNGRDGVNGRDGLNGLNGRDGKDGLGLSWKGNWLANVDYVPNDVVNYLGSTFIAVAQSRGKQPRANAPEWGLMAAAGASGPPGPTNLFVGTEPPASPNVGTVWIDTN